MKTASPSRPQIQAGRATGPIAPVMELELAQIACGWNARKCITMADQMERWAKQLRTHANISTAQRLQSN